MEKDGIELINDTVCRYWNGITGGALAIRGRGGRF
jgi:hypothetical protein